ncbi:MAG: 3-oxoacyl-ACP reductase FabG [Saprospiraceae bacterium]|nr:3-oxoacyl-ACP reductase FabG [Saprospiraceae bacterium]
MEIQEKIALVTGSSRGIGKAVALELARKGAHVVINYLKEETQALEVVNEILALGRKSIAIKADVGHESQVRKMAEQIFAEFGKIDILVNNAGIIIRPGMWDIISTEDIGRTIDTNLKGTIFCIRQFAPRMIENKCGRIINLTSTYAMTGAAGVLAYTSAKAGIISLTYAMARELGKHGITVNAVAPGNIDTEMTRMAGDGFVQWVKDTSPIPRLGTPEEIAEAVSYLVQSDYVSGNVLVVDGGHILNM